MSRIVIMGAAGRDFHNFNVAYRDDPAVDVVAFTAAQIPGIGDRRYPPSLAGARYPEGIPIVPEDELETVCRARKVDTVVFAYSDVAYPDVMHAASRALAAGADFALLGPERTMLASAKPVIAISAVRTGVGKSQVSRWISRRLRAAGLRVAALRHPMPYGDLAAQAVQRFATVEDLGAAHCTLEEREEYEPHIAAGGVVFAGVDYAAILAAAEAEADIVLWDGGNNDFPFLQPNLHIVLVDPLRAGDEVAYHPGEAVLRMADVALVMKTDAATAQQLAQVTGNIAAVNPAARILRGRSPVTLDDPALVAGKRVLVVEDGPTITHGGMATGAGYAAVEKLDAKVIDPRTSAVPAIAAVYARFPHIGQVLPAMGYDDGQVAALKATIEASDADIVVAGTPVDLAALLDIDRPIVRARYEYAEAEAPGLGGEIDAFVAALGRAGRQRPVAPGRSAVG
jgi:predicted GTPase